MGKFGLSKPFWGHFTVIISLKWSFGCIFATVWGERAATRPDGVDLEETRNPAKLWHLCHPTTFNLKRPEDKRFHTIILFLTYFLTSSVKFTLKTGEKALFSVKKTLLSVKFLKFLSLWGQKTAVVHEKTAFCGFSGSI